MKYLINIFIFTLLLFNANNSFAQGTDLQLAQQYYIQGDFAKAVIYYEKVYNKEPNHPNFARYYECLLKVNNLKEAEKVIRKQIDRNPENINYEFQYADFLTENNRTKEADKIYSNLIKQKAGNSTLILSLFNSFKDINRLDYAKQTLDAGRKIYGNMFLLQLQYAEIYYREKNYAKMMDEYLDFIDLVPNRTNEVQEILSNLIVENDENADFQEIVKNKILAKTQKSRNDFIYEDLLIWYFAQRKQFNVALTQVQALDKRENGQGKRVYELGKICLQNKDYRIASKAFKYVADIKDSYLQADAQKALLSVRYLEVTEDKNYDEASLQELIKEYTTAIQTTNNTRVSYQLLMQLATIEAYYANHPQKAISILKEIIGTSGLTSMQQAEAKVLLADVYVLTNEIWEASLLYMQVDSDFKFEPIGFEAKYKNARIFYFTGDFKFAQSQLDVLKQSTSKLIANDAMKLSILITDNFGLDSNYRAMKLFANADMLLEQHLYEQSFKLYDSISKQFPTSGLLDEIALRKATAMMSKGEWDKAIDYLNEIVNYHAEDILIDDALFYLGEIYEEHKFDTTKALEYYKKILFEHPASLYNADARERIRKLRGEG